MTRTHVAYIAPFAVFMLLLGVIPLLERLAPAPHSILATAPEQIIFPLQTVICAALLAGFWRRYELQRPAKIGFTLALAGLVFVLWIAPQERGYAPSRTVGFDPTIFENHPLLLWSVLLLRFLRLVIVVPLLEEIFWRGFLLRDLINRDFTKVPLGAFSWSSFGLVTLLFGLEHWGNGSWWPGPDFGPALCAGALFNLVAYRTRSLSSCILAHAATNLLLGVYIMQTRQWGFW